MDRKQSGSTASSTGGKHGEKKDENFLTKTVHTIRDKVHDFTDEVKEKTHNLTHSGSSKKKEKKNKDNKSTDNKLKTSSKPATAGKKTSSSDSDDEDDSPSPPTRPISTAGAKQDHERDANKRDNLEIKASGKTTDAPANRSNISSNKPTSNISTNKSSRGEDSPDKVHISFDGIDTVDDLLSRIDEAVEKAKLFVEGDKSNTELKFEEKSSIATHSSADPKKQPADKKKVEVTKDESKRDEPIRIDYKDTHRMEDLLLKINQQPGNRKVILENAPENSRSITIQKKKPSPPSTSNEKNIPPASTTTNENIESSGPPKSVLKISQDPSSLDTSTKTSSFEDDQIHVNIVGVQSVDELLDRVDDAIQTTPIVIDANSGEEKQQTASSLSNQNENNNQLATKPSMPSQKREAPKASSRNADVKTTGKIENLSSFDEKHKSDDNVTIIKVTEDDFRKNTVDKQASTSLATKEKRDATGTSDWI